MPLTIGFLQAINTLLLLGSGYLYWRNPDFMDYQAILFTSFCGLFFSCVTLLLLSFSAVFKAEIKWFVFLINLLLGLLFTGAQGYCLYWLSRENGFFEVMKRFLKLS